MRFDLLMLRFRQLQSLKHQELVLISGLSRLVCGRRRAAYDQVFRAKRLEFNSVGAALFSCIA